MPYGSKRQFKGKRRFSKKRNYNNGRAIKRVERKVDKINDMIELKYVDSSFNATVGNDGVDILLMNGMTVGTSGASNRVGNEIMATSIQFRGSITTSPDQIGATRVRCIVFWDRQCNNDVPVTQTFTALGRGLLTAPPVTAVPVVLYPYTYEQQDRYRILYDKMFTINPDVVQETTTGVTTEVVTNTLSFKKKIKLGRKVKYDDGAATVSAIATNSLYVVFYSDLAAAEPTVQFSARMYFKDA